MRILIAEDDQVLADGLLRSLRAAGYAVDQVSSGSEADAAIAAHLKAAKLIVMRDSAGLTDNRGKRLHRLSASEVEASMPDAADLTLARALRSGVGAVHVVDARRPEVLLLEILTCESRGTLILPDGVASVVARSAQYLSQGSKGNESESC